MAQHPVSGSLPSGKEPIHQTSPSFSRYRGFAVFLICCGLLIAAFAVSAVAKQTGNDRWSWGSFLGDREKETETERTEEPSDSDQLVTETETETDAVVPPAAGEGTPIVKKDLSYLNLGQTYIHNETSYHPDVESLMKRQAVLPSTEEKPAVLILHTHTGEAYLPQSLDFIEGVLGDTTYSRDEDRNVLAVGNALAEALEKKGITAIHCTVMHDEPTLSGSYKRSEETVKRYLELYPNVKYVIDLHRDSVTTQSGEQVRAVCGNEDESVAQVLILVGSDGNGTLHEEWEENLALALQLRKCLNDRLEGVCRPVTLRNESYNQELAKRSLLLEIGTDVCTVEEAKRSAVLVGEVLAELILQSR